MSYDLRPDRATWEKRLAKMRIDCTVDDWDSYGAPAMTEETLDLAAQMCRSLCVYPGDGGGFTISLTLPEKFEVHTAMGVKRAHLSMDFTAQGHPVSVLIEGLPTDANGEMMNFVCDTVGPPDRCIGVRLWGEGYIRVD